MHIHILGICGSFMGGLAVLAKQAGHHVTGCDANVYPPMSTQLEAQGIALSEGFAAAQIDLKPDIFVIGNVVSRGNPLMEEILNRRLPYISGPQWLAENVLQGKWVLAVAGTHGKTTTSAMLAWILEYAGLKPGFLIGGVPENFGVSARSPRTPATAADEAFFVIEADEYDTAFFDKRSKFVHYRPRTAVLNNLEYDHADIFADLTAIENQFHHLVRIIPDNGLIVSNGREDSLKRVLARGCWTPVENLGVAQGWAVGEVAGNGSFTVLLNGETKGRVDWDLLGEHNRMNALAALAAARHTGVSVETSIRALAEFKNVKRRMEVRGVVSGITVYDDFAHHPTAIATTIAGLRQKMQSESAAEGRIIAVLEPRSNTMKMGALKNMLAESLRDADLTLCYTANLGWDAAEALAPLGAKAAVFDQISVLLEALRAVLRPHDHVLIMSNGGFGGIHSRLLDLLKARYG
ncbi:MAG: UDP-N-acetylmuramate:L-alanyl-gamma-D-glutamyl-meso-diaminopimelate ligase [Burkholderiales bacterium]|nr:UDP-N-acetylmuramate:L-alanyl-gamma-D-glutamyl-meso-diaminopimelate ligase [Burkholderiales bacterium]